ncbi:MAG: thymidine kinase [Candidatus Heimdallarchaeota archaeon]|nr:thymidine kinase [Candidatus Heimdallarchaeota archaeon]
MRGHNNTYNAATIEAIVGTMFSGKSKELIERGIRAKKYGGIQAYFFKPSVDTRDKEVASRSGISISAIIVKKADEILRYIPLNEDPAIILIDEAQFFDDTILYTVQYLKFKGYNVVVAGLDKDFRGQPFGVMAQLMALSDVAIRKIYPVCGIDGCVEDGSMPQRLRNKEPDSALNPTVIIEGSRDEIEYLPVCRFHHQVPDLMEYLQNTLYSKLEKFMS